MCLAADTNGWADTPEWEREALDGWARRSGRHLMESRERIIRCLRRFEQTAARVAWCPAR
jgi:hypothetical protein